MKQQENEITNQEALSYEVGTLRQAINRIDREILINCPETLYQESIQSLPRTSGYYCIPQELSDRVSFIQSNYGQEAVALYQRLALAVLIQRSVRLLPKANYPEEVIWFYKRHFSWVFENLIAQTSKDVSYQNIDYYDYSNDLFLKDLGICSLRVFPVGAQVVELLGISRRFILNQGLSQFLQSSFFYLTKMGSNSPFYHVHLDPRWLSEFNQGGWHRFFKIMAEMLRRNPEVKGVFGSSWFYDPHLETISPGLLYLRKIPELGGAKTFKWGNSPMDVENATCKSARRKQLYEQGKYVPTSYIFIWSRQDLIQWAANAPQSFYSIRIKEI
ncbi:hypothetical protein [Leptolyngbya ohadii]|uniref:hypothetical protein n=1 Tax=Leptolyngbya ohadii TaxID=1962290 RepID=UPI00117A51E2|nr:hypothetical protein [Leptolyngbya ohadii]